MLVMLDLTAAFDTVDHSILLNDLSILGVRGVALQWFNSYLNNRNFRVEIGNDVSERGEMSTGIPQGTILAPIFFSIYTIELYYVLQQFNVDCHFYADDTQLMITVSDEEQAQRDFSLIFGAISDWMESRRLKLNASKTECILFGSSTRLGDLSQFRALNVGDSSVIFSETVRDLGVIMDRYLNLNTQMRNVKKKAIGNLINISRMTKYIDVGSRLKLVHGLVLSNLDFCNSLYAGLPNSQLRQLQSIINSASRLIVGLPRFSRERITPVCIDLHFLPIKARIKFKICLLVFKAIKFGKPSYIAELLKFHVPGRLLRGEDERRLVQPIIAQSLYSNLCFSYCAPRMYNSLPRSLREAETVDGFKKLLKTFIFKEAYNLTDYTIMPNFKV